MLENRNVTGIFPSAENALEKWILAVSSDQQLFRELVFLSKRCENAFLT